MLGNRRLQGLMVVVVAACLGAAVAQSGSPSHSDTPTAQPSPSPTFIAATPLSSLDGDGTGSGEPSTSSDGGSDRLPPGLIFGMMGAVILIAALGLLLLVRRQYRKPHLRPRGIVMAEANVCGDTEHVIEACADPMTPCSEDDEETSEIFVFSPPSTDATELQTELDRAPILSVLADKVQQLEAIEIPGAGFCDVRRGSYRPSNTGFATGKAATTVEVTVKSIHGPGTGMLNDKLLELLREVAVMSQFSHKNVVQLVGVVWKGTPLPGHPMALYEHMSEGPLDRYLRREKPSSNQQLKMSADVVAAVQYLSSVKYVLGNLSAKVVMVGSSEICKLGHFWDQPDIRDPSYPLPRAGLSWYAPELYRTCDSNVNPLWRRSGDSGVADKSMVSTDEEEREVSTEADVWALGMVLWEIFCNAEVSPYHKYPTSKIVGLVRNGHRPPAPRGCPPEMYKIMVDCWHPNSAERPSLKSLLDCVLVLQSSNRNLTANSDLSVAELQNIYKTAHLMEETAKTVSDVRGAHQRSPSPLIHMSLVGLKKSVDAKDNVKETIHAQGTISSRPSNYTSGTGSTRSTRSFGIAGEVIPATPTDDGRPAFTRVFGRTHSMTSDACDQDSSSSDDDDVDLKKGYLQISPGNLEVESRNPQIHHSHSKSAASKATASSYKEPLRRKSAVALAMEGVATPAPVVLRSSASLTSNLGTRRKSWTEKSATENEIVAADGLGTISARKIFSRESVGDALPSSKQRLQDGSSIFLKVNESALVTENEHRRTSSSAGADSSRGVDSRTRSWFKRSRGLRIGDQDEPRAAHTSPEPGALPCDSGHKWKGGDNGSMGTLSSLSTARQTSPAVDSEADFQNGDCLYSVLL